MPDAPTETRMPPSFRFTVSRDAALQLAITLLLGFLFATGIVCCRISLSFALLAIAIHRLVDALGGAAAQHAFERCGALLLMGLLGGAPPTLSLFALLLLERLIRGRDHPLLELECVAAAAATALIVFAPGGPLDAHPFCFMLGGLAGYAVVRLNDRSNP